MISANKKKLIVFALVFGFALSATSAFAEVPTATSTMDTLMTIVVSTAVSLATTMFQTYWGYILVISIILGLVYWFKRLVRAGAR